MVTLPVPEPKPKIQEISNIKYSNQGDQSLHTINYDDNDINQRKLNSSMKYLTMKNIF
jgi:hypothetical protein